MSPNQDNLLSIINFINTKFRQAAQDKTNLSNYSERLAISWRIQNFLDRELSANIISNTQHYTLIAKVIDFVAYNGEKRNH